MDDEKKDQKNKLPARFKNFTPLPSDPKDLTPEHARLVLDPKAVAEVMREVLFKKD